MNYIGITMGDPAGIGCEVMLKALKDDDLSNRCVIYGSLDVIEFYKEKLNIEKKVNVIKSFEEFQDSKLNLINVIDVSVGSFKIGEVSKVCGDAAYKYIEASIQDALKGKIKAVVTGPINKESLNLSGHNFAGHTEIFAELTNTEDYAMLLWSNDLKVVHVSTHVSLREACDLVKKKRVMAVIQLAHDTLSLVNSNKPKIAVAGLNPHAGESGLFGDEEIDEIIPAVEACKEMGIDVQGPIAPDTVFLAAKEGKYDVVVVMYHDQGHIPVKLLAFDTGVNTTIGLPIIRTSVDHGTAFNIAGEGIADERSMIESIQLANKFIRGK